MPLSTDFAKAFGVYGMLAGSDDFALAIMVGFFGLLHTCEIVQLQLGDFSVLGPDLMSISFRFQKGAIRT